MKQLKLFNNGSKIVLPTLSTIDKKIIEMRKKGYYFAEISKELNKPIGFVYRRFNKIRDKIKFVRL